MIDVLEVPLRIWGASLIVIGALLGAIGGFDRVETGPKPVRHAPATVRLDRWTLKIHDGYEVQRSDPFTDAQSPAPEPDAPEQMLVRLAVTQTGDQTTMLNETLLTAKVGDRSLGQVDSYWWVRDKSKADGGATLGPDLPEEMIFVWELSKRGARAMRSRPAVTLRVRDEQYAAQDSLFGNPIWRVSEVKHRIVVSAS